MPRALLLLFTVLLSSLSSAGQKAEPRIDGSYLVSFTEPPLAAFRGFDGDADPQRVALKATSPEVTGDDRLDVRSSASKAYRAWLAQRQAEHLGRLSAAIGRTLKSRLNLDIVNNAVLVELSADEAERIAGLPGVLRVEYDRVFKPHTDAGPAWIEADALWAGTDGVATRGEGVVVGIIDSGINRTHPSFAAVGPVDGYVHANPRGAFLGLCATTPGMCNGKLIGIYDFTLCTGVHAGSSCDDREANVGLDQDGHGSHVASIAVGNRLNASISIGTGSVQRPVSGVALHANLIAYKACEEEEDCRFSWVLAAINQAVADRVDVINYSIGSDPRDPWTSSDALAMLNAREAGAVVVVSAGNDGPRPDSISSPADAPWVIAAANTTHDRAILNRLVDLSGGATPPPQGGVLLGVGSTAGYGPARIVVPLDFPGCSTGSNEDFPPTGASNPWTGQVFNGEIVVCRRGTQARVAKSNNVRLAGGGGMVLTNTAAEGESIVADEHSIPSTHVGVTAGDALRQWLATGSNHTGRIEGAQLRSEAQFADLLNASSSRGPAIVDGILKPNASAPGTSILAAAGNGNGLIFRSGTSMAAPHIAGAAALLRAARPAWTVSDIESTLVSTSRPVVRTSDGAAAADPFAAGSGRIDVERAVAAGLGFPVSNQAHRNARPAIGGQPMSLNLPAVVNPNCVGSCSFVREVRDLRGGGRWRVEAELPAGAVAAVTPSEFQLAAGASQPLQISLAVSDPRLIGTWVSGALRLQRIDGGSGSDARIAVHVFSAFGSLPSQLILSTASDRGFVDANLTLAVAVPDLQPRPSALAERVERIANLVGDPTPFEIYDDFGAGTFVTLIPVPASAEGEDYRLLASLESQSSPDVDLFVGFDSNGDGLPQASEEQCRSTLPGSIERCDVPVGASFNARNYWVLARSLRSGSGSDQIRLVTAAVPLTQSTMPELTVSGPARVPANTPLPLRYAIDQPRAAHGARRLGFVGLAANEGAAPFAWQLVEVQRGSAAPAERALVPGRVQTLRLQPGEAAERWFIDVPLNASSLTVNSIGTGEVDLYLARADSPTTPMIAPAPPRSAATASATGPGATHQVSVAGAALAAGRWYVTPVNAGTAPADLSLQIDLAFGAARAQPRFGAYFDPARDGSGLFLFPAGDAWGLAWYTYLQDRQPTWYLGAAARPGPTVGSWQVDLLRYRWNGERAIGTRVGEALLSLNQTLEFDISFSLDSQSGQQHMVWIGDTRCPQVGGSPLDVSGLWFSPERPGFGYSVIASSQFESIGAYYYDDAAGGVPRWVLGQVSPFGAMTYPLQYRTGSCPLCDYLAPVVQGAPAGTITRNYSDAATGQFRTEIQVVPGSPTPSAGDWRVDLPAVKLSDVTGCQ